MSTEEHDDSTETGDRTADEIRRDILQAREELGDTVEALAAKTDVKAQARHAVDDAKSTAKAKVEDAKATVTGKAEDAKAAITGKAEQVKGAASSATPESAQQAAQDGATKAQGFVKEHPQAVALVVGLAVGLLVGRWWAA